MTAPRMKIVRNVSDLRATIAGWKLDRQKSTLVPTMGALHRGHLEIVRMARTLAERTIVSIFVNPIQFNNPSDLANYPRTLEADARLLEDAGVDLLFAPKQADMYPDGFATKVSVARLSEGLCGAFRPGHFEGVATVVAKLFNQSGADYAVLGEKDYQQLHVVRRMTVDLDIPIGIIAHPTVREADGLAMSSRNTRLTLDERKVAPGHLHGRTQGTPRGRVRVGRVFRVARRTRSHAPAVPDRTRPPSRGSQSRAGTPHRQHSRLTRRQLI